MRDVCDETMRMQAMLLRYGSRFAGNNVQDEAQEWVYQGFSVNDAESWCEIGVWDAPTAAQLRDAGLSPEKVKSAASRLTEGLDDPSTKYTDGNPIYAMCNGDIKTAVIITAAAAE